jgi:hypothetical protein
MLFQPDATPDEKGEFKIFSLNAGRYRLEPRLPNDDLYTRSITASGQAASVAGSKQWTDAASAGISISSGQRVTGLTVTLAEGAAAIRGKVVSASESVNLPSRVRVHLVPAEPDSADDILRYAEAAADGDGAFSISNLAPGRYFVLARAVSDEEFAERTPSPLWWDAAGRAKLRREAVAANVILDLKQCQHLAEYVLKYKPPSSVKPRSSKSRV